MDSPGVEREPERMEGGTYFPVVEVEGGREEEGSTEAGASSSGPAPVSARGRLVDRHNNGLKRDKKLTAALQPSQSIFIRTLCGEMVTFTKPTRDFPSARCFRKTGFDVIFGGLFRFRVLEEKTDESRKHQVTN
jgi:hypothetical protein